MNAKITRRQFMRGSTLSLASLGLAGSLGFDLAATASQLSGIRTKNITPVPTVCPYCGSGCGLVVYSERDGAGKLYRCAGVYILW